MEFAGDQTLNDLNVRIDAILEKSRTPLADRFQQLDASEFRAIVFQLVFSLHKAQKGCQFVHGDLHLKNLMLKPNSDKLVSLAFWFFCIYVPLIRFFRCTRTVV